MNISMKNNESENIFKKILEKESWEDLIYYIVSLEGIDPWNVDLVNLTDSFIKFVKSAKNLDFRIPAKIVFVCAILLKIKSDYLSFFKEKESITEKMLKESKPFEELGIDSNITQLGQPIKRIPKRQVTLEELIFALKSATKVKEKREIKKRLWRKEITKNIKTNEESIEHKIQRIMNNINKLISISPDNKITFRNVVNKWNRSEIIEYLLPVLHLEQENKITTKQEDFFKDIFIKKK